MTRVAERDKVAAKLDSQVLVGDVMRYRRPLPAAATRSPSVSTNDCSPVFARKICAVRFVPEFSKSSYRDERFRRRIRSR